MQLAHALPWIQVTLGVILAALILVQHNSAGVGASFGGGDTSLHYTRRGAEKVIFYATIVAGALFVAAVLASSFVSALPA